MQKCHVVDCSRQTGLLGLLLVLALTLLGCRPQPGQPTAEATAPPQAVGSGELLDIGGAEVTATPQAVGSGELLDIEGAEGVIFTEVMANEQRLGWLFGAAVTEYWTPSSEDVLAMEVALPVYLQAEEEQAGSQIQVRGAESLWRLSEYTRQYVGVIRGGEMHIYANFFCHAGPDWQERWLAVEDGGACYFSIFYDPQSGNFDGLSINGES